MVGPSPSRAYGAGPPSPRSRGARGFILPRPACGERARGEGQLTGLGISRVFLVFHRTARGQGAGLAARIPDLDGGDGKARRRLRHRGVLLSRAHLAGQGRAASRSLRSGVRALLQGHRDPGRSEGRAPRGLVEEARRAVSDRGGEKADRGARRLGKADGDIAPAARRAKGAAPGRQQMDRHRRHLALRRLRLQPRGRSHRPGGGAEPQRGQGLGQARVPQSRRYRRARHPQHQAGVTPAATICPRGRRRRARSRRHRKIDRAQCRLARSEAGAGTAQYREALAVHRCRRVDGGPRPRLRGAVLGGALRVQAPDPLLLPQLHLRFGVA